MIAPLTSAFTHSPMMLGTLAAGVTMTAKSTGRGTALISGYALFPRILARLGLIGNKAPPKELFIKFQSTVRPTLPGFSVAPITATAVGLKKTSKACRRGRRISWAEEVSD